MSKRKKRIIVISIPVILAGAIFTYVFIQNAANADEVSYDIYEITQPADLTFSGKVESVKKQIVTYNQSLGEITSINVENGATVSAGDVLLTYASEDNTSETVITADFDGTIAVDENARTDSTAPIVSVYNNEQIVDITVTEYDIEKLTEGQAVTVSYMNQAREIAGTISFISTIPLSETDTITSYCVEISLSESVPLGYTMQVSVPQNEVRIPISALLTEDKKTYVFKYESGKAVKTEVTVEEYSSYLKVTRGLSIGDAVIENPSGVTDQMEVNAL